MHGRLWRAVGAQRQRPLLRQPQQRLQQLRRLGRRCQLPPCLVLRLAAGRLALRRSDVQQRLAGVQQGLVRRGGRRTGGRSRGGAAGGALQGVGQQLAQGRRLGKRLEPPLLLAARGLAAARGVPGVGHLQQQRQQEGGSLCGVKHGCGGTGQERARWQTRVD